MCEIKNVQIKTVFKKADFWITELNKIKHAFNFYKLRV